MLKISFQSQWKIYSIISWERGGGGGMPQESPLLDALAFGARKNLPHCDETCRFLETTSYHKNLASFPSNELNQSAFNASFYVLVVGCEMQEIDLGFSYLF